jgi:serine/threonine protein kinase
MSTESKPDAAAQKTDEDRLAHALVSRGLVTREEIGQCRPAAGADAGPGALLTRLVDAGLLTPNQARRATQELSRLLIQQIPGYELVEKLGQGSMGVVYKARQLSMNRLVAIKVLLPRLAANPRYLERFTHEAHIAAKLSHNNIVQAIDVGSAGKLHYFVMEYVEGTTIKDQIEAGKVYGEKEGLEIIVQVAQALAHAHRRKLIHRDIKPANIILTSEGIAKLADLGLARQSSNDALAESEKGMVYGTPYYIAPEQIRGQEDVDVRADMYSLGATLYHMVTGRPPFPGKKAEAIFKAHLDSDLTPPDHLNTALSSGLGEVVEFMMAKDRRRRYQTPDDLIIDLECLLAGQPPKLVRQKIEDATLERLAGGEAEHDEDPVEPREFALPGKPILWVAVLGGVALVSVLLNLILLLKR